MDLPTKKYKEQISFRVNQERLKTMDECVERTGMSATEFIELGITLAARAILQDPLVHGEQPDVCYRDATLRERRLVQKFLIYLRLRDPDPDSVYNAYDRINLVRKLERLEQQPFYAAARKQFPTAPEWAG